jgi:hypothetical protein
MYTSLLPALAWHGLRNKNTTHLGPLLIHAKIKFIFIPLTGLLPQPCQPILLRVVVPRTENIVFVLFQKAKATTIRQLGALLVIAPVQGIAQGGGHDGGRDEFEPQIWVGSAVQRRIPPGCLCPSYRL